MSDDGNVKKIEIDGIEWTYIVKDGYAVVGDGTSQAVPKSTSGAISIPSTLGGCPVAEIGNGAFRFCSELTSVMIPEGVKCIGNSAFFYCESIVNVTMHEGVVSIGQSAFSHCKALMSLTIPESITSIGDRAFWLCGKLASVRLPSKVPSIGERAFADCSCLESVRIPGNVTSIGESAFAECNCLENVTIDDGVTRIGVAAFEGCRALKCVVIPKSVATIGGGAFRRCEKLRSVTIPAGVMSIEDGVFYVCSGLESMTIPDGVTSIGREAFGSCRNLVKVKIPRGVTSIGSRAFAGCTRLKKVDIPDGVMTIGDSAFYDCSALDSVAIPDSVTDIGYQAFYKTPFLGNQPDGLVVAGSVLYAIKGGSPAEIMIPAGVRHIGRRVFSSCGWLKAVTMPDGVLSVGDEAFSECEKLESVTMPASLPNVGEHVFYGCRNLKCIKVLGCRTVDAVDAWKKWVGEVFSENGIASDFRKVTTAKNAAGQIDLSAQYSVLPEESGLPSFMLSAPAKAIDWERSIHDISSECHALLSGGRVNEGERRENVSRMLQAAFAIAPEDWQILNERDAAQYFFLFCGCLGIPSLTWSHARVEFVQGGWHGSYFLFDFTYGRSANDALCACESRHRPRTEMPDETRYLFGVNYNPEKHNIDKPLTASFHSECTKHVPNFAASDSFCSEFKWFLTSRDKCGRGDDAVPKNEPMDVKEVLAWLRQRRKQKESESDEETERNLREEVRQKVAEATESDDLSLFVKKVIGGLLLLLLLLAIVLRFCFLKC